MSESRRSVRVVENSGPWAFFFLLAYIGAAIYFISHSDGSFWAVILGLLQAIVWPSTSCTTCSSCSPCERRP